MREMEIEVEITSKDIDDVFIFLNTKTLNATHGSTLNELFDNQQQFLAAYNEWIKMKRDLSSRDESEYIQYMNLLESRNHNLEYALEIKHISFDEDLKTVSDFIKKQSSVYGYSFPFASDEIVAWDSHNFILKDSIYYNITHKHAVFYLARLDKVK